MGIRSSVTGLAALTALFVSVALGDTPLSVLITDPAGDTSVNNAPAYQDVVGAEVTGVFAGDGDFYYVLRERLAGPVTAESSLPPTPGGIKHVLWNFGIDTDETTAPAGYPLAGKGDKNEDEFMAWLTWDGESFTAVLVDRRPLLDGEQAELTEIEFEIDGDDVLLFVPAVLLGDPDAFLWRCGTTDIMAANLIVDAGGGVHAGNGAANSNGTEGYLVVDLAGLPATPFP